MDPRPRTPPRIARLLTAVVSLVLVGSVGGAASAFAPLPFFYDLHTFRGDDGTTAVVAAVAVPVKELRRELYQGRVRYRFDIRFVLTDTVRREVIERIDSVYVSRPAALPRRHLLHTVLEIPSPPSDAIFQRIVVTDATRPGVGQLYQTPFTIPDYGGTELMLSDIAFGLPDATRGWQRRGETLALLPTSQFPRSAFDVYYEVYNLPPSRPYSTEIAIAPIDDDGEENVDETVRVLFSGDSRADDSGVFSELRRLESQLSRGRYRVTVTVTDQADGRVATRSRVIEVRGTRGGATLVPALPKRGG
ncbi:MAG: hypothetical protein OEN56_07040 [Gemmatimonadota bacterium]|nr:hypothetical protein [Gemmatimonadota bacterium]